MRRVVIGEFGAIERLGIRTLLNEEGCNVVAEETARSGLRETLAAVMPDVLVTELVEGLVDGLDVIAAEFPSVKVVACSSTEPVMKVFPRFRGATYSTHLSPPLLVQAVMEN